MQSVYHRRIFSNTLSPHSQFITIYLLCAFDVQNVDDSISCAHFFVVLFAAVESLAAARNVCSCQHNCSVIALNVAFMLAFHTYLLANCSVYQNPYCVRSVCLFVFVLMASCHLLPTEAIFIPKHNSSPLELRVEME